MTALESQSPPSVPGGQVWPLSRPDYRTLGELGLIPENTELLYGTVYHKMAKSPLHSFLLTQLLERLRPLLPPNHLLRPEQPIVCSDSEPEPNISVVRGAARDFLDDHPHHAEFGVEICVSSPDYDRAKLRAYASAGIPEVWLVLAGRGKG